MSRYRPPRRSSLALTIIAAGAALLMLLAGLVSLLPGVDNDESQDEISAAIQVTPGAEVARLQTAVTENRADIDSIMVLAEMLANSGRIDESVPWFERAVEARPEDVGVRIAFGRSLQRAGKSFDAELQFRRALEIDPHSSVSAYYLGLLHEQSSPSKTDSAREWYRRAIEIAPDSIIADQARERLDALDATRAATPAP